MQTSLQMGQSSSKLSLALSGAAGVFFKNESVATLDGDVGGDPGTGPVAAGATMERKKLVAAAKKPVAEPARGLSILVFIYRGQRAGRDDAG